jgi:DNA-binding response OmpR family regulator
MYLERENYRVEEALDGEAALEAVKRLNPALVVLDIMIPKLDGFEVCRRLRAVDNLVAIILLTARDEDMDKSWVSSWAQMTIYPTLSIRASS